MIVGPYRSESILISGIRYRERRSRRRTRDVHLRLALLVIPSAAEEALIFLQRNGNRCLGPSRTGVFARHDKMGPSRPQERAGRVRFVKGLRQENKIAAVLVGAGDSHRS